MSMKKTILLVDDDVDVLESTQYILMSEGYEVITSKNGEEAVTKYKENKPDITFLDIRMPVMDGYDAFFKIKEFDPKAKVIFITAFSIDEDKYTEAKKNGLLDLINKPFSLEDLKKIIAKYT